jgi:uncharacterized protein YaeQ
MALPATVYRMTINLSDVDRGVYETLELRLARHPSETVKYLLTRVLAYALSYEDGIAFSKGGLSNSDEPPVAIHDATGLLLAWIDVGMPSAERLHKASKAARRVALFTSGDVELLRRDAASRPIHRAEALAIWRFEPSFLAALETYVTRDTTFELVRTEGQLYATIGGAMIEGRIERLAFAAPWGS